MTQHGRSLVLEGWFLHVENVLKILGTQRAIEATKGLPPLSSSYGQAHWSNAVEEALASYLGSVAVPALAEAAKNSRAEPGMLVWLDQAFYFKGLAKAHKTDGRASFSAHLDTDDSVRVEGDFSAARVMSSTGALALTGRSRQFMLAYITALQPSTIKLRPLFIGQRYLRPDGDAQLDSTQLDLTRFHQTVLDAAHIWPQHLDVFADVDFGDASSPAELAQLKSIPEKQVKTWFAEIIGEPDIPEDWGGEQFDLWSGRVTVRGQPMRTAIAFKGPAVFRPMTISHLGKNGDQIDRLFATAADLLVLQHCHRIKAPVINMLRTYATHPCNNRSYMTIDGYQTLAILRHFGRIDKKKPSNTS